MARKTKDEAISLQSTALDIAARVMQASGLCRYESPLMCKRLRTDETTCEACIRAWLIGKARKTEKQQNERSKT